MSMSDLEHFITWNETGKPTVDVAALERWQRQQEMQASAVSAVAACLDRIAELEKLVDDLNASIETLTSEKEAAESGFRLETFLKEEERWSADTFGHGTRTMGLLEHIREELEEIEQSPHDLMEWIDVLLLAFDGCWRHGYAAQEVVNALQQKLLICKSRSYPPINEQQPGQKVKRISEPTMCLDEGCPHYPHLHECINNKDELQANRPEGHSSI